MQCTKVFTITMSFPCIHTIQTRMYRLPGDDTVKIGDIHPHWDFKKPPMRRVDTEPEATPPSLNPLLIVVNLAVVRPRADQLESWGKGICGSNSTGTETSNLAQGTRVTEKTLREDQRGETGGRNSEVVSRE